MQIATILSDTSKDKNVDTAKARPVWPPDAPDHASFMETLARSLFAYGPRCTTQAMMRVGEAAEKIEVDVMPTIGEEVS